MAIVVGDSQVYLGIEINQAYCDIAMKRLALVDR